MAGKLDAFTLQHMRRWVESTIPADYDREGKIEAVTLWLEALDDTDRAYYLNAGWREIFRAADEWI